MDMCVVCYVCCVFAFQKEAERKYAGIQEEGSRLYETYEIKCKQIKDLSTQSTQLIAQNKQLKAATTTLVGVTPLLSLHFALGFGF